MSLEPIGPNAEQIKHWNEISGPKWVELQDLLDEQIGAFGREAQRRADFAAGQRVIDVGCGCGQTSLEIAGRVGDSGAVTSLDLSEVMLDSARERARDAGLNNVTFVQADAQVYEFEPNGFDRVFSRFGVMFFADPGAAFTNLNRALVPGGHITLVCWQELARNPWLLVPSRAVAKFVELPAPPAPGAPGPFSLADRDELDSMLVAAGFRDASIEPYEPEMLLAGGPDLDRVVAILASLGPAGTLLREADEDTRSRSKDAIREAITPFQTAEGVRMELCRVDRERAYLIDR